MKKYLHFPYSSRFVFHISLLAAILPFTGCGTMIAGGVGMGTASAVVGAGSMVTKGAFGVVRQTVRSAGSVAGMVIPENDPDVEAQ